MTSAFLFIAILLVIGVILRVRLTIFEHLYIPASVIAGALGLGVVQLFGQRFQASLGSWVDTLGAWPGWLIAVVFAGMLLERKPAPLRESLSRVGRQGLMVWVIVLGQTATGLWIAWLLVQPFYDVPNSFGMLIETGFAGGHGTAAAMGQVFAHESVQLEGGLDLGILMATAGLLYGVVSGIVWINLAVRFGWVKPRQSISSEIEAEQQLGKAIGYARVRGEAIDPLLLQILWLALALGIGMGLQTCVGELVGWIESWMVGIYPAGESGRTLEQTLSLHSVVGSFPLFIYTLFGGWMVRRGLRMVRAEGWIDPESINRLTSTAMDILVVSAITTLNLTTVATLLVPFALMLVGGAVWCGICLLLISRWILPKSHWFELGLINYGMSTGTTATGFVLLRLVDPELESGAAEDYALAAPLSSPFVGGGMITVGLPLFVLERVPIAASAVGLCVVVSVLILAGRRWNSLADV